MLSQVRPLFIYLKIDKISEVINENVQNSAI
jgi:hypothetical protein